MNDTGILALLIGFFIILAVTVPIIALDFGETETEHDTSWFDSGTWNSYLVFALNISGMAFWTWGGVPAFVNLILIIPRLIMIYLAIKTVRGIGG